MLLMSAAEEVELEKWRTKYGGCLMPNSRPRPQPTLADSMTKLPRLAALFIQARLKAGGWLGPVCLEPTEVTEVEDASHLPRYEIMARMLDIGAALAQGVSPLDAGNISAVVETKEGGLYVGAPIMWRGQGVKFSVHAIQSAVLNAWYHGDTQIKRIMVDAPPCVCCRQFLRETWEWNNLGIMVASAGEGGVEMKNGAVRELPLAMDGLKLDSLKARFLGEPKRAITLSASAGTGEMVNVASEGASLSYAPYTKNYAGIALRTKRGTIHRGRAVEIGASMAGLTAVESAFADLALCGNQFADVDDILLIETKGTSTQFSATQKLATAMNNIKFRFVMAT
jgi:cytidine deaminase